MSFTSIQAILKGLNNQPDASFNSADELLRLSGDLDPSGQVGKAIGIGAGNVATLLTLDQNATVAATGANYTTVADALDAGEIAISVVGDATETRDPKIVNSITLEVRPNVNWNLGDHRIRIQDNDVEITGIFNGNIIWSPTTTKNMIDTDLDPFTADVANGSPILTNVSIDTGQLVIGQIVNSPGPGIQFPSRILSIDSPTQITLDQNCNSDITGLAINSSPAQSAQLFLIQGIILDMTGGTADDCKVYNGITSGVISGLARIAVPNQHGNGLQSGSAFIEFKNAIVAIISLTAGNNCYECYSSTGDVDQIVLVGNFSATNPVINPQSGSVKSLFFFDIAGAATIKAEIGGGLNGFSSWSGTSSLDVLITADGATLRDGRYFAGSVDIQDKKNVTLYNCSSSGLLDMSDAACSNNKVLSCAFDTALVIGGDDNDLSMSEFVGGITDNGLRNALNLVRSAASAPAFLKGTDVFLPRYTTTEKNAISAPIGGMILFDTTLAKMCVYSGSAWETITSL